MTRLIFQIKSATYLADAFALNFSTSYVEADLFNIRLGEEVAFGLSETTGVWRVLALGRLAACEQNESGISVKFDSVEMLTRTARLVTQGDKQADSFMQSHDLDVFSVNELDRLHAHTQFYKQADENVILFVKEARASGMGADESVYGQSGVEPDENRFFHRVASAYENRCAFTGIAQPTLNGLAWEGVAVALDPEQSADGPASQGLYASSTFAFYFRHGLVAIGDRYDILQHKSLNAKTSAFLAAANPEGLLYLPQRLVDWPDLDIAQRHRRYFGY